MATRAYEAVLILTPDLADEALATAIDQVKSYLAGGGESVTKTDTWGRRRMYHEVKGHRDGYYLVLEFPAEPPTIQGLEDRLRLDENVIRSLVVRADA